MVDVCCWLFGSFRSSHPKPHVHRWLFCCHPSIRESLKRLGSGVNLRGEHFKKMRLQRCWLLNWYWLTVVKFGTVQNLGFWRLRQQSNGTATCAGRHDNTSKFIGLITLGSGVQLMEIGPMNPSQEKIPWFWVNLKRLNSWVRSILIYYIYL